MTYCQNLVPNKSLHTQYVSSVYVLATLLSAFLLCLAKTGVLFIFSSLLSVVIAWIVAKAKV